MLYLFCFRLVFVLFGPEPCLWDPPDLCQVTQVQTVADAFWESLDSELDKRGYSLE